MGKLLLSALGSITALLLAPLLGSTTAVSDDGAYVVGEFDFGGVHLTSEIGDYEEDEYEDGGYSGIPWGTHHHGHVGESSPSDWGGGHRELQAKDLSECVGYPSRFTESFYVVLNDIEGKMDTLEEFEAFSEALTDTLNECTGRCTRVDAIDILAQFFFEDRKRKRRNGRNWRKRAVIKAWGQGLCKLCDFGENSAVNQVLQAEDAGRRLESDTEADFEFMLENAIGERRLQSNCAMLLKQKLTLTGFEAFECLTIAEISSRDPRCEMEAYLDELEETRRLGWEV